MSDFESVARALLSLAAVVTLMWMLGRWARGRGRRHGSAREGLEVIARQSLTRNASVMVVRVADQAMVLGVTEAGVNLLGEVPAGTFELAPVLILPAPMPVTNRPTPVLAAPTAKRPPVRALEGSVLSLRTWSQAVDVLRERTVRR